MSLAHRVFMLGFLAICICMGNVVVAQEEGASATGEQVHLEETGSSPARGHFLAEEGAEVSAWKDHRNQPKGAGVALTLTATPVVYHRAYLKWRLDPSSKRNLARLKARVILTRQWHHGVGKVWLRPVLQAWQEDVVTYDNQPKLGARLEPACDMAQSQWVFQGPQLDALIRRWLADPSKNFGLAVETNNHKVSAFASDDDPVHAPRLELSEESVVPPNNKTQVFSLPSTSAKPIAMFQANERVCFIGDSITHIALHLRMIRHYYQTRFPDDHLVIENGGISGDSLPHVLQRFASDIAPRQASYYVVMMGMNDARIDLYRRRDAHVTEKSQREISRIFEARLNKLCDLLQATNAKTIVLMSPTIYDQYAKNKKMLPVAAGYNDGLAYLAQATKRVAQQRQFDYIPMYEQTLAATQKLQAADPSASYIGLDRIHPNINGYALMTAIFLQAQKAPRIAVMKQVHAKEHRTKTHAIAFDWKLKNLPMAIDPQLNAQAVALLQDFNHQILKVDQLSPESRWVLRLNGQVIHEFTASQLAEGIDLASFEHLPWAEASEQLLDISTRYRLIESERLRDPLAAVKFYKSMRTRWNKTHDQTLPEDTAAGMRVLLKEHPRGYVSTLYKHYLSYASGDAKRETNQALEQLNADAVKIRFNEPVKVQLVPVQ